MTIADKSQATLPITLLYSEQALKLSQLFQEYRLPAIRKDMVDTQEVTINTLHQPMNNITQEDINKHHEVNTNVIEQITIIFTSVNNF